MIRLTNRKVLKILPLTYLNTAHARNHHRLQVFAFKGVRCVVPDCPCEGAFIAVCAEGKNPQETGLHYDVYTADWELMTVDPHVAKVNGGGDHLANKFPMCEKHNSRKGILDPKILYERVGKL